MTMDANQKQTAMGSPGAHRMHSDNSKLDCFAATPPLFQLALYTNTWVLICALATRSMTAL
ncbi:hypothetical protein CBM2614_U50015 [Cupriavidus taiwanensis]|uniref:Uncharacterized protein n=1 Tax=Cupriavidus taiwanensis TaxID=164546 RepID=A0A375EDM6_9BURK|nr:hypothetical protein CBM2614_U50015 [Cupriavidus taiwanensis]SOZ75408.1 hypothetical protein CBM2613_U40024 [Cupriavidus taiwanensis]